MNGPYQFAKWNEWLEDIWQQLLHLAWVDDVFWQIQSIIASNEKINKPERFQSWIAYTYVHTSLSSVRRIADNTKKTRSLSKLLDSMRSNTNLLTRKRFIALHKGEVKKIADGWFDEIAGGKHSHIPKSRIQNISAQLTSSLNQVNQYSNDYVNHLANTKTSNSIRYVDVRIAIVHIFQVYKWCSRALNSSIPNSPVAVPQTEWLKYLRIPWLDEKDEIPEYEHLDKLIEKHENSFPV